MNTPQRLLAILCLLSISGFSNALSLADVDHQIQIAYAEVLALKKSKANDKSVRVPGIQVGKTPLHAYAKGLELLEKIQKYQIQNSLSALELPNLPIKKVRSKNVMAIAMLAQTQLNAINQSLNIAAESIKKDDSSKTASDLYEHIWQTSFVMDTLIDPIKPADVLRNVKMAENGLAAIAKKKNKDYQVPALQNFDGKKPVDVTIGLFKLLYKLAELERKFKIKPLVVPAFPTGNIKPEDAYEASGSVIADLTRIALKLKIAPVSRIENITENITPSTVYAHVYRLNQSANLLLK
jgi:hypothetical protein